MLTQNNKLVGRKILVEISSIGYSFVVSGTQIAATHRQQEQQKQ